MKRNKALVYPRLMGSWEERTKLAEESFNAWAALETFVTSRRVMSRLGAGITADLIKLIRAERRAQNKYADYVENHGFPIPMSECDEVCGCDEDCGRDTRCPVCASLKCREYDNGKGIRYECAKCRRIYVGDTAFSLDFEPEGDCPVCGNSFLTPFVDDCLDCGRVDETCVRCPSCGAVIHDCGYIDKTRLV